MSRLHEHKKGKVYYKEEKSEKTTEEVFRDIAKKVGIKL